MRTGDNIDKVEDDMRDASPGLETPDVRKEIITTLLQVPKIYYGGSSKGKNLFLVFVINIIC